MIETVSPRDQMWADSPGNYFELGMQAARWIKQTTRREFANILDFACGHGRVLRSLKATFPQATLTACDIDRDAVTFCAETFGAKPIHSAEDPSEVALASYDLIWCGSLFTHIHPKMRWGGFFDLLEAAVDPEGVVCFTTAGRRVMCRLRDNPRLDLGLTPQAKQRVLEQFDAVGYAYEDYPNEVDYGISLSAPSFVCSLIEERPGLRLLAYDEMACGNFQDIVACRAAPIDRMPEPS
jgi:SAM-dependent methyltransferase